MQSEMVARAREEINDLRHANEELSRQVEGLQMSRFSEVEELVYLRWVNACLRYELKNYQTQSGKISARDLNKNLSPRSQEKAKRLLQEYAGSECEKVTQILKVSLLFHLHQGVTILTLLLLIALLVDLIWLSKKA